MLQPLIKRSHYGKLNCITVDGGPSPSALAVIMHGYGAPGTDLVGLAQPLLEELPETQQAAWRFVFPEAPFSLAELGMPGGRAWWQINMQQLVELSAAGQWDRVRDQAPPGIDQARDLLVAAIEEAQAELPPDAPLVLGGFSQGAMLAMDTAIRGLAQPAAGLILFSGTLVCESIWRKGAVSALGGRHVFQSHGTWDPILPFVGAQWLRELLEKSGAELEFLAFDGPHTITDQAITGAADVLSKCYN